ncbi:MAG: hypothetical protein EOP04_12345 [Proteobacteria bacterium]|nr:MAG: hypothetical protein EOP04_12345 [Pseudomonadota bacterium]
MICTNDSGVKSVIDGILGLKDMGFTSTIIQLIEEAKSLSDFVPGFLPMVGHLTCIEQFGRIFEPKTPHRQTAKGNHFKRCLTFFTSLPDPEIEALYGLRNGMVHDSSMCNINDKVKKTEPAYANLFRPGWNTQRPLVQLPARDWKGDFSVFDSNRVIELEESTTYINITEFPKLLREIHDNVVELHKKSELFCTITSKPPIYELMARFALLVPKKK